MKTQIDQGKSGRAVALALGFSMILAVTGGASAAPIVDGRLDPSEGYFQGRSVNFAVEKVTTIVPGGELWVHEDVLTGDVTVLFTQPLTLVDNTYGDNAVGWGKGVAPSGKNHNFKDLKGSDNAQFVFTDGAGDTVLDVIMDYISETSEDSGVFRSLGVTGGDGGVNAGSAASVLQWGTSLDYNFNALGLVLTEDSPATDASYTENPLYQGWVFEVTYELRVSGSAFGPEGFGEVSISRVHDSPNKIGKNKVYPDINGAIPELGTIGLLALGAIGVLVRRRRQRA